LFTDLVADACKVRVGRWVVLRAWAHGRVEGFGTVRVEVAPGHPLFDAPVIAIACCEGCDDVVFSVEIDPCDSLSST